jgi:hypothetical protein
VPGEGLVLGAVAPERGGSRQHSGDPRVDRHRPRSRRLVRSFVLPRTHARATQPPEDRKLSTPPDRAQTTTQQQRTNDEHQSSSSPTVRRKPHHRYATPARLEAHRGHSDRCSIRKHPSGERAGRHGAGVSPRNTGIADAVDGTLWRRNIPIHCLSHIGSGSRRDPPGGASADLREGVGRSLRAIRLGQSSEIASKAARVRSWLRRRSKRCA